jgi:hypothetical protein
LEKPTLKHTYHIYLTENYRLLPNQVTGRKIEIDKITKALYLDEDSHGTPIKCLWIQGERSMGKSMIINNIIPSLYESQGKAKFFGLICRSSINDMIRDFCDRYELNILREDISLSALGKIVDAIVAKYSNYERLIFVVDEPEKIYKSSKPIFADFIHALYDELLKKNVNSSIVFVSTEGYTVLPWDNSDLSRLKFIPIIFTTYNQPQILAIAKQRLQLASVNYEPEAIEVLAVHIASIGADIRQLLSILHRASEMSEETMMITYETMISSMEVEKFRWLEERYGSLAAPYQLFVRETTRAAYEKFTNPEPPQLLDYPGINIIPVDVVNNKVFVEDDMLLNVNFTQAFKKYQEASLFYNVKPLPQTTMRWCLAKCEEKNIFSTERLSNTSGSPISIKLRLKDAKRLLTMTTNTDFGKKLLKYKTLGE